jgi:hypothetical protein
MLGDDFRLVPEFELTPEQGDEWKHSLDASMTGELTSFLDDEGVDFPVDEWLYGTARVRDQMHALEQITLLAEGFERAEPELTPIQLPYRPEDSWLALEFPEDYPLDKDRVLYTAHYTTPFAKDGRQCGLLVDEWTEVIPGGEELTGIAFNFDRPSSEAPQALLLVTPATWDGSWQWDDLLATLDETLELAKKRAVEPAQVDETAYSRFLPATVLAATLYGISIATPLAVNNGALDAIQVAPDG